MMKNDHRKQFEPTHEGGDDFDRFLAKQLQESHPYLDDDNFTVRVMGSLPAPKKLSLWQERFIILAPLVLISLLVLNQFSVLGALIKLWFLVVSMDVTQLVQIGMLLSVVVVSSAALWFARQLKIF